MKNQLSLDIQLTPQTVSGELTIHNHGGSAVNLWAAGNAWGDSVLSFEVDTTAGPYICELKPQIYTINVPETFELPAGQSHVIPFDLNDGTWENGGPLVETMTQLTAIYEIVQTPEAEEYNVWCGYITASCGLQ